MSDAAAPGFIGNGPSNGDDSSWAAIESSAHVPSSVAASASRPADRGGATTVSFPSMLRAMPLGTVVDEGGRVARRHGKAIFTVTSAVLVPAAIAEVLAARAIRDRFLDGQNPLGSFRIAFLSATENDAGSLTAFLSLGLGAVAALFIGAYVSTIVADERFGRAGSQRAALAVLAKRAPALVVAWLITHAWVFLVFWAGQANGGLAALVAVLAIPFALMSTYLAPVVVLERLGPLAATRRSWSLAKRTFGATTGYFALSSMVGLWFRFGLALFPAVIHSVIATDRYQWLLEGVGAQIGIVVSAPIVACSTVVMYLDIRTRTEGMDLFLEADRVVAHG